MNLKTNKQALATALSSVAVALSTKCSHPYGNFVILTASGSDLTIVADSIQLRAEAVVKCHSKSNGAVLVSHGKLAALLQRQGDDVSLVVEEKRLKVAIGSSLTYLPLMPIEGFPPPRAVDSTAFAILDTLAFSSALQVVCPFAGDGLSHLWDTGLLLLDDGKDFTIAACDGKQFSRIVLPTSGNPFKAVLPAKTARSLAALIAASESLSMSIGKNSVVLDVDGLSLQVQQADYAYPEADVAKVCDRMAENCSHSVTVDRSRLVSELQIASAVLERDEDQVAVAVSTDPQSLLVSAHSKSSATDAAVIDTKVAEPMARRRVNHTNLVNHLRSLDCERVTLFYNAVDEPRGYRISPEGVSGIQAFMGFFADK